MTAKKRNTINRALAASVWLLLGIGLIVLLVAAITKKNGERVVGVEIQIDGVQNHYFIDKKEVFSTLEKVQAGHLVNSVAAAVNLTEMERELKEIIWIKEVEMFFDNNNVLQVKIMEREPIARIFTFSGKSFYIDSALKRLPLSVHFSPRIPVFTNFPSNKKSAFRQDSALLCEIKLMATFIGSKPFWMAQIEQVNISGARTFELIPKLGNQLIRFGSADNYKEKFRKLMVFYKKVQARTGWNRYSILDLQFKNQVVAVNRDLKEIIADSLRTIQIMKSIIEEAKKNTNDSTLIQLPELEMGNQHKIERPQKQKVVPPKNGNTKKIEKNSVTLIHHPEKPVLEKPLHGPDNKKTQTKNAERTVNNKPIKNKMNNKKSKQVPKAVMPPKKGY